ncbi:uncharacterized protein BYT42DRAFT_612943 [Radiomyces spectabilis]|uniref:uncharacterized protein n=1 Tax=Radiomyces spectabilis TaxID=64574 RepID=UPI00221F30B8|nr:uncharacterized protein BYT42DRAFT_612943 [Radiomyces spectabilis]KAI8381134.1 hypothetical protein BYT42DRAFT_612943 [Radiomyces spectabilis]
MTSGLHAYRSSRLPGKQLVLGLWQNTAIPSSLWTMASYLTIGAIAITTVSFLFCFFLFVSLFDDFLRVTAPSRMWGLVKNNRWIHLEYTSIADIIKQQLANLAEWEKRKRASWYPEHQQELDRFHDFIISITSYLGCDFAKQKDQ